MRIKNEMNTSLAAKGALAHRLQRRTACKIQNGHQGAPKWLTGSGTPRLLGVLSNFRKTSLLIRALLLWEKVAMGKKGEKKGGGTGKKREKTDRNSGHYVIASQVPNASQMQCWRGARAKKNAKSLLDRLTKKTVTSFIVLTKCGINLRISCGNLYSF